MYEVLLSGAAERDLKRLPSDLCERAISAMKAMAHAPRPPGCRKIAGSKGDWRIRLGDYRILYEIDDGRESVKIMRVRHRREVYR